MAQKTLWFDVETTGTNPQTCSIVQLSGIIDVDGKIVAEFNFDCRPDEGADVTDEALTIIGKTREQLESYQDPAITYRDLLMTIEKHVDKYDKSDKFYPAGYNVRFDLGFLQAFFVKRGNKYGTGSYQNWRAIDVMQIAHYLAYTGKLSLDNYKLGTLCDHFGIQIVAHDSMSDIKATRELFYKLQVLL